MAEQTPTTTTDETVSARKGRAAKPKDDAIDVLEVRTGRVEFCVLGNTPMICNRMSEKARHELLLPGGKKNAAARAQTLKHNPREEYRASPYRLPTGPTQVAVLATAFKKAMMTAALDLPGTKKAQIGRLLRVEGHYTSIYGVPELIMAIVRSADMNRTPDVRSRAILPRWACKLTVSFVEPMIQVQAVVRLLAAAGIFVGVGDWRQEKGSGSFGLFRVVEPTDAEFLEVIDAGQRAAQVAAFENPACYDEETADLLAWWDEEITKRSAQGTVAAPARGRKPNGRGDDDGTAVHA